MRLLVTALLVIGIAGCFDKPEPAPKDELDRKLQAELPKASYEVRQQVRDLLQKVRDDLVFIEGGSFLMGDIGETDADGDWLQWTFEEDDNHVHKVTLDSYALSRYETTWGQLRLYFDAIGVNPYKEHEWWVFAKEDPHDEFYYLKPAEAPTWAVAKDYCQWLGRLTGLPFDLPTEAQWEYAARSRGQAVRFATQDGTFKKGVGEHLNGNFASHTRPISVGSYPPNPLGLYDMTGNAKEWTRDWYQPDYYEQSPELNPQGPETGYNGVAKVMRDWGGGPGDASIPARGGLSYVADTSGGGIRCAANIKAAERGEPKGVGVN